LDFDLVTSTFNPGRLAQQQTALNVAFIARRRNATNWAKAVYKIFNIHQFDGK
jgi:hypothetical protein